MDRRAFLATGIAILAVPLVGETQAVKKTWQMGVVGLGPLTREINDALAALRSALREHGHQIVIEYRWPAAGHDDAMLRLSDELVALRLDALVVLGERALLPTVPIFRVPSPPPLVVALYNELRPSDAPYGFATDIVGVSTAGPTLITEQVRLVKDVVPCTSRLAILWDPSDQGSVRAFNEAFAAANAGGLRPQGVEAADATHLERAFAAAASASTDAVLVIASATSVSHATRVVDLAARYRLPAIYPLHEFAETGGLMSYGASFREALRRAAAHVDRILKGGEARNRPAKRKAGRLAIEPPTRLELVLNLKTAKALDLTIPPSLLLRADRVIE